MTLVKISSCKGFIVSLKKMTKQMKQMTNNQTLQICLIKKGKNLLNKEK